LQSSCEKRLIGKGPIVTKTIQENNFSGIDLRTDAKVYYSQDSLYHIDIAGQENVLDAIEFYVKENNLIIKERFPAVFITKEPVIIHISGPNLTNLEVSGSGRIDLTSHALANQLNLTVSGSGSIYTNQVQVQTLKLDISGSGNINMQEVNAESITSSVSGSGDVALQSGNAKTLSSNINGSGKFDARNLPIIHVTTKTSGSGKTYVHFKETLYVNISGSGDVYYYGEGNITKSISGSGKLIKL
ncbi:MAG: DUF2807 domain-containing protein, partial [Chitinophagaceae bacterium]|nr:DUF2807 domain-containing protein [Chitinophagaceae bacterium]